MTKALTPDICVIGAGTGGLAVAQTAAAYGAAVVLVEKAEMGGGRVQDRVRRMALLAAARQAHAMRTPADFGIAPAEPWIDFKRVMQSVRNSVASVEPAVSRERLTALGVTVIKAEGRFKNRTTLTAGDAEIRARRFVVAVGSAAATPNTPGLESVDYLTEASVFGLTTRPDHLIILGGEPSALEFAQAFRRLGCAVTIIHEATLLTSEDPEMTAVLLRQLRAEGICIVEGAKTLSIERNGDGVRLQVAATGPDKPLEGSHLLVLGGRTADTAGLDLRKGRIALRPDGAAIDVSAMLRTRNPRVYAIGAATGERPHAHLAQYHAGLVLRALLFRLPAKDRRPAVSRVVLTDPELAHVGLTEKEARQRTRALRILRWPFAENDRAQAERNSAGHVKLVADRAGRILGATIAGANASELIQPWALALEHRLRLRDMAAHMAPSPTRSEIGKRAAMSYFTSAAQRPLLRRLAGLLRKLG
jgi:pyruvate/2-oxoglutarate dehydrogenase complex dihydrolipoamide dehydrogenase (E3) component